MCLPLQKKSVECLMSITADHIEYISKDDLSSHHHKLLELFLMALDYRAIHYQVSFSYSRICSFYWNISGSTMSNFYSKVCSPLNSGFIFQEFCKF